MTHNATSPPASGNESRSLLDFPDEILELIVNNLSGSAMAAFSDVCPRFEEVTKHHTKRLRIPSFNQSLLKFLSHDIAPVRHLDLTNCHSSSRSLRALVLRCPSVDELNVVNSGLSFHHLLDMLDVLGNLKTLSFSVMSFHPYATMELDFKPHFKLQNVYAEFAACEGLCGLVVKFVNGCFELRKLHLNMMGLRTPFADERTSNNRIEAPIWQSLNTFIFSCELSVAKNNRRILDRLFECCRHKPNLTEWMAKGAGCFVYEHGVFNVVDFQYFVADEQISVLKDIATHSVLPTKVNNVLCGWFPQRGLTVDFPYKAKWPSLDCFLYVPRKWPASLVELDLTQCHFWLPKLFWKNLAACSASLEALAIPVCALLPVEDWQFSSWWMNRQLATASAAPVEKADCRLTSALKVLKLRRLRLGCKRHLEEYVCDKCRSLVHAGNLGSLDQLEHLDELTLYRVHAHPSLYAQLANRHVRTVRLCLQGLPGADGLHAFIEKCSWLERFKLEYPELDLSCSALWSALAQTSSLRELCLSTESTDAVDLDTVNSYLPKVCEYLRVLHVHAKFVRNRAQLQLDLQNQVKMHNVMFPYRKLYLTHTASPSFTYMNNLRISRSYPGRSLCCAANFIAKVKPTGWDFELTPERG